MRPSKHRPKTGRLALDFTRPMYPVPHEDGKRRMRAIAAAMLVTESVKKHGVEPPTTLPWGFSDERVAWERERALPPYQPGPGDHAGWERVLAIDPTYAPALPVAPLRGVFDGTSRELDAMRHRVDRLRLLGNGCVSDTVAKAFVTLYRELNEPENSAK